MSPEEAIAQAKSGELLPLYLVVGEEQFLRDQVVAELRTAALSGGLADFNEDRFTAGEIDVTRVISAARTVPMMARRRFVLVRGVERWEPSGESDAAAPLDQLADYANAPIDSTCVVMTAGKLDGRRRLSAIAKKRGFIVACDTIDARALPGWIASRAASRDHTIARDAAELLAELSGPELGPVCDAIERLSLYVGVKQPITEQAISECIARVRVSDTWALVDAVGRRDLARALVLLHEVYDPRDRGLMLLGALAWSMRQLARFVAAVAEGASPESAAKSAGAFQSGRARELAAKGRGLRPRDLERWMVVLAETDLALKGSRRPPEAILEEMFTRLCRK